MPVEIEELFTSGVTELDLFQTLANFILCLAMGFLLRSFYRKHSYSLTGKKHIASILPLLAAIVFMVITVVKSSLALSLGLVGALSIVRFRTPIKEPEELVYLFLAIAIGLGYGAGQTSITTITTLLLLCVILLFLSNKNLNSILEYNLVIQWPNDELRSSQILEQVSKYTDYLKLIRMERGPEINTIVLNMTLAKSQSVDNLIDSIRENQKNISISFYQSQNA